MRRLKMRADVAAVRRKFHEDFDSETGYSNQFPHCGVLPWKICWGSIAVACFFLATANSSVASAHEKETSLLCPRVSIFFVDVKPSFDFVTLQEAQPVAIKVTGHLHGETAITIVAVGPILNSFDHKDISIFQECTNDGVALTATIVHENKASTMALKNVIWRPRISVKVSHNQNTKAVVHVNWRVWNTSVDSGGEIAQQLFKSSIPLR
jgi:hypothetical protein